ncbi:TIGR00730 family Rossman fold protein [Niveibacterium sp. 24ML]|uniref:LOG family protein n=1 Tax=Niveibacterium sp. 24ML TaxID=2985512 RepID=UPI0022707F01|nr:TIGR00730 family Rossman fold protein [Niveibacterium sp. 24ML]MCX9157226.1 TIGR00730 family Rossman fold protein [Niveibacterium sp. 24ML]
MKSICVFCGARHGERVAYRHATEGLGKLLADEGIELVWGGGHVGLMGVVADAVLKAGGRAFGVIPDFMAERELEHPGATEMRVVDSMHTRKAAMAERAEGFIALPGGYGTLDELFEILTWGQLHIHRKPIGLLNVEGFYEPLIAMVRHMVAEGFVKSENLDLFCVADTPEALLAAMRAWQAPAEDDWVPPLSMQQG